MKINRRAMLRAEGEERKTHRHATNPFTDNWKPEVTHKSKRINLDKRPAVLDTAGNRVVGTLLIPVERDSERFVKLVRDELPVLRQLSATARVVLDFAMYQALPNNAVVWMPPAEAAEYCKFKARKSFYDGITELIIYEYLARTEKQGFYFLNPQRFFNGNRQQLKNTFSKPKA